MLSVRAVYVLRPLQIVVTLREKGEATATLKSEQDDRLRLVFAFAGLVGRHAAVRKDEAGDTSRSEMMEKMLDPGKVRIADGRSTVSPPDIFAQAAAAPIVIVERWIC